ncbi:hypothetical protein N9Y18_03305 [Litoricolaceae bacterium]|nr:hypothetical protein [Litorivicinaceae bacterium]
MNNRLTALIVAFILVVGSSAYAGFRSSSQGSGTYTPPAGVTPNPLGDTDGDGTPDGTDTDDDNDGTLDVADAFPLDATESLDTDFDGIGDNADTDDDGDTIPDGDDAFPLDATQSIAALADSDVTTSCTENTCTVSGPFPSGATTITVTGTHASAPDQTATDTSGGTFSVTFNNLQAGTWAFAVTASNTGTTHLVSASSSGSSTSLADAIVNAISDPSEPVTASDLTASSLPSAVVSDLTTNSNCGTSGTENCLTWFNSLTASTACTSLTATSTNSEIETYVNCVMIEGHTSVANSATIPAPTSTPVVGCSNPQDINFALPSTCGHSQWTCSVTNGPTGWNVAGGLLVMPAAYTTGGSVTVDIEMALGIYTPSYTKTVSRTYDVQAAVLNAVNGKKMFNNGDNSSGYNVVNAQNYCRSIGGRLATSSEWTGFSSTQRVFHWDTSDPDITFGWNNCGDLWYYNSTYQCTPQNTCTNGGNKRAGRRNGGYWCGGQASGAKNFVCADLPSCN